MVKSYETCSEDELSKIVFRGVEVKKSKIGGGGGWNTALHKKNMLHFCWYDGNQVITLYATN